MFLIFHPMFRIWPALFRHILLPSPVLLPPGRPDSLPHTPNYSFFLSRSAGKRSNLRMMLPDDALFYDMTLVLCES